jgi:hypothetical protein
MCKDAEFVDTFQSLLDAGNSMNKVAAILNVHHSKVNRLLNRGLIEIHVAFDEHEYYEPPSEYLDWLYEDLLEKMCDEAFENLRVSIKEVMGEHFFAVGRYVLDNYGGIYGYLSSKKMVKLRECIYKECTKCGEDFRITEFSSRKKFSFGLYTACNSCQAKKLNEYLKKHPEYAKVHLNKRRARKVNLPDTLTVEEYEIALEYFGRSCALTGQTVDLEQEHAIPISIGHGGTAFENCYPMANGLNQSKNNNNIFEWFEANRQRFELSQERFDKLIAWLASANAMTIEEYRDHVYWCHANPRTIDELEAQ